MGAETAAEVVGATPLGERAVAEPGLRQNWRQFALLVLVNAFVGGMVGIERAILPLVASQDFGLASSAATLSFIMSFGVVKAATNLFTGYLADHVGRKRLLVVGWVIGLPVPLMLMWAPTWTWIIAANALLGLNQGLCWSTTVIMKIDLVGSARRGLAMGLNEFAGYGAVAAATVASAYLADLYGLRPWPFLLGVVFAVAGLVLSWSLVQDTAPFVAVESRRHPPTENPPLLRPSFLAATAGNRQLFACNQAGLVNNLNDGVAWGLFPLLFAGAGLDLRQIGTLAAMYTMVWCISQVATGALSDRWGRKWLIVGGMCVQGVALWMIAWPTPSSGAYALWLGGVVLLGLGTAFVYPTLLAAIGDVVHPAQRGPAIGVYRFWRDLGYAVGALVAGLAADRIGMRGTIAVVAALTFASGLVVASRMRPARH